MADTRVGVQTSPSGAGPSKGGIRSPQNLAAGLFLIAVGALGFWGSYSLNFGRLAEIGPGLFPRAVSILVALFGCFVIFMSLTVDGAALSRWNLRGLLCVMLAILFFATFIRGASITLFDTKIVLPALGLLVCVPVVTIMASFADPETSFREIVPFAIVLTVLCIGLFRYALRLSMPVAPWLPYLGY